MSVRSRRAFPPSCAASSFSAARQAEQEGHAQRKGKRQERVAHAHACIRRCVGLPLPNGSKHGCTLHDRTLRLDLIDANYGPGPPPEISQHNTRVAMCHRAP